MDITERRKSKRLKVKDDSLVVHGNGSGSIGQVVDIGHGGIAFHYIGQSHPLDDFLKLSVRQEGRTLQMENIQVKTVSDFEIIYDNPIQQIPLRRRGVKFGILSAQQIKQLETLIHLQE
ncbi:MAG: PilZ domain-containing protein [Thermodesulfobacteriota bacterium]